MRETLKKKRRIVTITANDGKLPQKASTVLLAKKYIYSKIKKALNQEGTTTITIKSEKMNPPKHTPKTLVKKAKATTKKSTGTKAITKKSTGTKTKAINEIPTTNNRLNLVL
jgi:hypothetical protein